MQWSCFAVTLYRRAPEATRGAAVRDAAWERVMADPRMQDPACPFDAKRMIYGGFQTIAQS